RPHGSATGSRGPGSGTRPAGGRFAGDADVGRSAPMSPSSLTGLILAALTLVAAALPLVMSLDLDADGSLPAARQAAPPGADPALGRAFDAEAVRQGLERGEGPR